MGDINKALVAEVNGVELEWRQEVEMNTLAVNNKDYTNYPYDSSLYEILKGFRETVYNPAQYQTFVGVEPYFTTNVTTPAGFRFGQSFTAEIDYIDTVGLGLGETNTSGTFKILVYEVGGDLQVVGSPIAETADIDASALPFSASIFSYPLVSGVGLTVGNKYALVVDYTNLTGGAIRLTRTSGNQYAGGGQYTYNPDVNEWFEDTNGDFIFSVGISNPTESGAYRIGYSNSASGLSSDNLQEAVDEIALKETMSIAGEIKSFAGDVSTWTTTDGTPQYRGLAVCNGAVVKQSDYPELYAAIGDSWNSFNHPVDGTPTVAPDEFALPNLQGLVQVGVGSNGETTYALGTYYEDLTAKNGLSNSSSSVSGSADSNGSHFHQQFADEIDTSYTASSSGSFVPRATVRTGSDENLGYGTSRTSLAATVGRGQTAGSHTHTLTASALAQTITGDVETRPRSAGVSWVITVRDTAIGIPDASETEAGLLTTGTQNISGNKNFLGDITTNQITATTYSNLPVAGVGVAGIFKPAYCYGYGNATVTDLIGSIRNIDFTVQFIEGLTHSGGQTFFFTEGGLYRVSASVMYTSAGSTTSQRIIQSATLNGGTISGASSIKYGGGAHSSFIQMDTNVLVEANAGDYVRIVASSNATGVFASYVGGGSNAYRNIAINRIR